MNKKNSDLYKQAYDLLVEGRDLNRAEEIFNQLLNKDQNNLALTYHMASLQMRKGHQGLSYLLYNEVLRIDPLFQSAINNQGVILKALNKIDEAREKFNRCIELEEKKTEINKKEMSEFLGNLGSTYIAQGTPQEAVEILTRAITLNPDFLMPKWNRSLAYLELGNYEQGFDEYDAGDRIERTKNRNYGENVTPFWDGTPGKTVAVYGEQGIGDELMFASIIPDIMKDCNVIFDAHPRLADLFRYNFPTIPIYGTRKEAELPWKKYHDIDAKISIGSLGKFYRKNKEDFPGTPYLKAEPKYVKESGELLNSISSKPKVGISWRGGTDMTNKNHRKIPMESLLPLIENESVDFISLQYNPEAVTWVEDFNKKHSKNIYHYKDILDDYDRTSGLVSNLDLIISVPQSVVHLAGSLGTPTFQLCPKKALWQMGPYGEDMPWYSCVKNIWQEEDGDWDKVIEKAREETCNYFQTTT